MSEAQFWLTDPCIFFKDGNYYKIIPNCKMTTNEILNSMTLLLFYLIIICLLLKINTKIIFILIILIILIIVYYFLFINNNNKIENHVNIDHIPLIKTQKINPNIKKDNISFAKWLYDSPQTCKENSSMCLPYQDIRYNRNSETE